MSSVLFAPVCSIAPTRRRRFMWAAWWTVPPTRAPFRKPDAFEGGALTREEARRAAERAAGVSLTEIEDAWARAWSNLLLGKPPFSSLGASGDGGPRPAKPPQPSSVWDTLGLAPAATVAEIKRAYRQRALQAHPDRGGDAAAFRALHTAYESALRHRAKRPARK